MDIETALVSAGYEVVGNVKTAQQAVKLASAEHPSLAIMDIRLDGRHDGIDAALVMFRAYGVRSIFATAHANAQTRARAEPAAPLGWLDKPFSMETLLDAIERALAETRKSG
jgi:DNA-binding NarL/FixJ family response regulator